jgi:hypothetical protein
MLDKEMTESNLGDSPATSCRRKYNQCADLLIDRVFNTFQQVVVSFVERFCIVVVEETGMIFKLVTM